MPSSKVDKKCAPCTSFPLPVPKPPGRGNIPMVVAFTCSNVEMVAHNGSCASRYPVNVERWALLHSRRSPNPQTATHLTKYRLRNGQIRLLIIPPSTRIIEPVT